MAGQSLKATTNLISYVRSIRATGHLTGRFFIKGGPHESIIDPVRLRDGHLSGHQDR